MTRRAWAEEEPRAGTCFCHLGAKGEESQTFLEETPAREGVSSHGTPGGAGAEGRTPGPATAAVPAVPRLPGKGCVEARVPFT